MGIKPTDQENPYHITLLYPFEYFIEGKVKVLQLLNGKRRLRGNLLTPSFVAFRSEHKHAPYSLQSSVDFLQSLPQPVVIGFFPLVCFLIGRLPF